MSNLSSKLEALKSPNPSSVVTWLKSLPEEDWHVAWEALTDEKIAKSRLLSIFNEEGGRFGKDTFFRFRQNVLEGKVTKESIRVSK